MTEPTVEVVALTDLTPHPQNYRVHPQEQIDHIVQSITDNGIYRPVVIAKEGTILAGHGLVLAVEQMGRKEVDAYRLPLDPGHPKALKVLAGDNAIASLGPTDDLLLSLLLGEIQEQGEDLLGSGYDDGLLTELLKGVDAGDADGDGYSLKVESPVYTPTGPKPPVSELYDDEVARKLSEDIRACEELPAEVAGFLLRAAERHVVFDFHNIAEYYAHSSPEVQDLMERSALVIIDFNKAIEEGFVRLTEEIAATYQAELDNEDA